MSSITSLTVLTAASAFSKKTRISTPLKTFSHRAKNFPTYEYVLTAVDASGNESAPSAAAKTIEVPGTSGVGGGGCFLSTTR